MQQYLNGIIQLEEVAVVGYEEENKQKVLKFSLKQKVSNIPPIRAKSIIIIISLTLIFIIFLRYTTNKIAICIF